VQLFLIKFYFEKVEVDKGSQCPHFRLVLVSFSG